MLSPRQIEQFKREGVLLVENTMKAKILLVLLATATPFTHAQTKYPTKPVRIVTVGASSQNDLIARLFTPKLAEAWGQPIVIDNRPGAGGALAATTVAKATADGYTLLLLSNQFAIGAALHANLPYDAAKDFAGVTRIGMSTGALVVPPSLNVKTVAELIALGKSKPVLFSSSGAGSGTHMSGEMFRVAAGIKAVHVGFKSSSDAAIEVAAARVQYGFLPLGPLLSFIKDGRMAVLAVADQRTPQLPDVPAITEVLPNFERAGSFGILAPAGTPRPILLQINKEVRRVFELPEVKEKLAVMSFVPGTSTPEEFEKMVRKDIEVFNRMVRLAGLRK